MSAQNSLSIDFLIPFGDEEWPGLRVSFHRWLPIGKENGEKSCANPFSARPAGGFCCGESGFNRRASLAACSRFF
jgi:hypothetical protein